MAWKSRFLADAAASTRCLHVLLASSSPDYGARVIRLPNGKFRYQAVGPVEPPRDAAERADVAATMQHIMSIIEGWVREHPEQWLWLHKMWR